MKSDNRVQNANITIEGFDATRHSVEEITNLLHRSYAKLLDMGLHFWATHQNSEVTHRRLNSGFGYVMRLDERIVGTITYYDDFLNNNCQWYTNSFVSRFGQFAVEPDLQKCGLGTKLIDHVEDFAKARGKTELALDTSENAQHLIEYYARKGFRHIQYMQWDDVNYRSVVMSKKI